MNVANALQALGITEWVLRGEPTSENEFNVMFRKVVGEDGNGSAIESSDPFDFGVTWAEIEAEVDRLIAEQPAKEARDKRDRLLTESDWVTIRATDTNNPVPTEWQTYRQALRDVPLQTGFPEEIEWPEKPES